jgi:predicted HTH transcriptional regulator
MPRRAAVEELTHLLESNRHEEILGIREDTRVEFKMLLNLALAQDRHTLAKSAAAFANTSGGMLLLGVRTERDVRSLSDYAAQLLPVSNLEIGSYYKVLSNYLYPLPQLTIDVYGEQNKELLAIRVHPVSTQRPVLVTQTVSETLNGGTIFGLYTRTEEGIAPLDYAAVHALLQTGQMLTGVGDLNSNLELVNMRLDSIESKLDAIKGGPNVGE